MDFAEKFCKAKKKLLKLDVSYNIGKFHSIHKFLNSLGPCFNIFYITFIQTYFLLLIKAADRIANIVVITFDKIVIASAKKEQWFKQKKPKIAKFVLMSSFHSLTGNQIIITVLCYIHYKKNYYFMDNCWILYLNMKKANTKKNVECN